MVSGIFSGMIAVLISITAIGLREFCYELFAIFIITAHRNFDVTALLTTFVCSYVFQKNLLIYSRTVVFNLFMNECSLKILFIKLLNVCTFFVCFVFLFFFCFLYHMKFMNMHV